MVKCLFGQHCDPNFYNQLYIQEGRIPKNSNSYLNLNKAIFFGGGGEHLSVDITNKLFVSVTITVIDIKIYLIAH